MSSRDSGRQTPARGLLRLDLAAYRDMSSSLNQFDGVSAPALDVEPGEDILVLSEDLADLSPTGYIERTRISLTLAAGPVPSSPLD